MRTKLFDLRILHIKLIKFKILHVTTIKALNVLQFKKKSGRKKNLIRRVSVSLKKFFVFEASNFNVSGRTILRLSSISILQSNFVSRKVIILRNLWSKWDNDRNNRHSNKNDTFVHRGEKLPSTRICVLQASYGFQRTEAIKTGQNED